MFCGKCGAQNDDNAVVCASCATPFENIQSNPKKPGFKLDNRMIGIIAIAAVAIVAIIAAIFPFGGTSDGNTKESGERTYKAVIKDYFKAIETADAKDMIKLVPDDIIDGILERADLSKREYTEKLQDGLDGMIDYLEDEYGDFKITYKIGDTEKIDEDDLENMQDLYGDMFDIKIKDAMTVEVEVTLDYEDDESSRDIELTLIKVGSSWYMGMESMSDLLF